jgi:hypothetical protein
MSKRSRRREGGEQRGFWQGQQVSSMPPLSLKNRFDRLLVEEVYELNAISSTNPIANDSKAIPTTPNLANPLKPRSRFQHHPKWEQQLPE